MAELNRRISATVTPHRGNLLPHEYIPFWTGDSSGSDLGIGEHADQGNVSIEIPRHQLACQFASVATAEQVDSDSPLTSRIPEDVGTGEDQGLTLPAINNCSRAA